MSSLCDSFVYLNMSYLKYRIIKQGFLEAENQGKDFDMITGQGSQE